MSVHLTSPAGEAFLFHEGNFDVLLPEVEDSEQPVVVFNRGGKLGWGGGLATREGGFPSALPQREIPLGDLFATPGRVAVELKIAVPPVWEESTRALAAADRALAKAKAAFADTIAVQGKKYGEAGLKKALKVLNDFIAKPLGPVSLLIPDNILDPRYLSSVEQSLSAERA